MATHDAVEGALSAVEQDELPDASGLEDLLARIAWPEQVAGCALAVERIVVPPEAERELPEDDADALRAVAEHPGRADVRLLVAVTRDGSARCLLRQRDHDSDDRVALGDDIAPGLVHALRATFSERLSARSVRGQPQVGRDAALPAPMSRTAATPLVEGRRP